MTQHQEEQRQPAHLSIPSEPSVFVVEDNIVLVLRPQEFLRSVTVKVTVKVAVTGRE